MSTVFDSEVDETISEEVSVQQSSATALILPIVDEELFRANLARLQVFTSYTGPVPTPLDEFVNIPVQLKGMVIQYCHDVNEETGEERRWTDVRFKTTDGQIIGGGGKAITQFASLLNQQLGQGDWPLPITVLVKKRKLVGVTKEGQPKYMPVFQIIG